MRPLFDPREIKKKCNGMLRSDVYKRIYDVALVAAPGSFIEVGAAHAAATISLASALRDSGRQGKVYAFEKAEGGSRAKYGGFEQNRRIIEDNIAHFGLKDRIVMIYGTTEDNAGLVPPDDKHSLLILDADGRIDRDFALFFNMLSAGAAIIIDDVENRVRAKLANSSVWSFKARHFRIDQKHRISKMLVEYFAAENLLTGETLGNTFFGQKGIGTFNDELWPGILACYRELVFADAVETRQHGLVSITKTALSNVLPDPLLDAARRLRDGR